MMTETERRMQGERNKTRKIEEEINEEKKV